MTDDLDTAPTTVPTDDGELLGGTVVGDRPTRSAVAVVTHPHPRFGGDMHNLVVATLARGLAAEHGGRASVQLPGDRALDR